MSILAFIVPSRPHVPPDTALHAEGLLLRPFECRDAECYARATRESVASVSPWMPWCRSDYSVEDASAWFGECAEGWADQSAFEFGIFSADGADLLGGAGLNQFNEQHNFCNLGYWVRESHQRRGIAPRVIALLAGFGFRALGLTRIEIVVAKGNLPSRSAAVKAGASFEGVARNRLVIGGEAVDAWVHALVPPG